MRYLIAFLLLFQVSLLCAQNNPYGLTIINSKQAYRATIHEHPEKALVDIQKAVPGVVLDIRYATKNNFMKQVMYPSARAFARKPVVAQLKKIQAELKKKGYGLKIFDAYRPYTITLAFYQKASDKDFVAHPKSGSRHNRGCAVDLSIIDLKTGKDVAMPTPYDSFSKAAAADYQDLPPTIKKNRDFLIGVMQKHGFQVMYNEWWHYDFRDWEKYELMDMPFKKL
jgi:D-alanyl-D-alanine dipeptidase